MKKLYNPMFILLTVTLPQLGLLGVFGRIFWFLHTELSDKQIDSWIVFGTVLGAFGLGFTIYSVVCVIHKKALHVYTAYGLFGLYFCLLIACFFRYTEIIPASMPRYMLMGVSPALTILTLTMPALAHGMMMIIEDTVERYQLKSVLKPFLFMVAIPLSWYLFINFMYVVNRGQSGLFENMVPIVFVVSSAAFLFLFGTLIYVILKKKSNLWYQYMGIIVFLGSLMGLALNQSLDNVFGDFSHFGFYLCNVLTTSMMMIPKVENKKLRLLIFLAKSCLLWYSFYFFIVFLPYAPLSLVGILAFGLGILLLMPIVLLFVHIQSLWEDYSYLLKYYKKTKIAALFMVQLLVFPGVGALIIQQDHTHLNQALRYTYQRSYSEENKTTIDTLGIKRALSAVKHINADNQRGNGFLAVRTSTPYLTALYQAYALDHLSISPSKVKTLEHVFLGQHEDEQVQPTINAENIKDVHINEMKYETHYDPEQNLYKSWIHFDLENTIDGLSEFYTVFKIPEGSYITNYYLYVGNEKKYGIIADKRAANWIYEQNKVINRDPGVLTYLSSNQIEFKIFPFEPYQIRKTGIEIIHPTPINLTIEDEVITLKTLDAIKEDIKQLNLQIHPAIRYITKEMKANLPKVTRSPKYYFIVDRSKDSKEQTAAYIQRIKDFIETQEIAEDVNGIIGVSFEENRIKYEAGWEEALKKTAVKGGFYADYTVKRILYEHYNSQLEEQPVFILVTDAIEKAIFSQDYKDLSFINPEGLGYYHLSKEQKLTQYALQDSTVYSRNHTGAEIYKKPVLVWQGEGEGIFYLPDNNEDSIILTEAIDAEAKDLFTDSSWENGILLQALYRSYLLSPDQYFEKALTIVKGSIVSQVMSPLTSFIVLENKAQEKIMLEKQKQILQAKKPLDIGDMTEMEEPPLLGIGAFVIVLLAIMKKKKQNILPIFNKNFIKLK
ncbi:MSEP-CTERM sorting domain-containing protein [Cellulosilyticum sp. I15G10I2]|uniref:MSEP-CTERM sorting domain-containing protein n=1 Tax=Cellulosilyticum sp. I15G10I2 TaxID=1892843 RepID=UPI00085C0080|nr:MSEP-CTERM sorting domain-containing protein [Cellulosilyticum sp. I15G10I2]